MEPETVAERSAAAEDVLAQHGYKQELKRELGYFSSFALSFSIISVTTGLFADYGSGLQSAGPAFVWTWLIVGAGQFLLALVFSRLSRTIPLSGYAYQWTRALAGDRLAWWAGWLMVIQFLTGMPGVCYALASYLIPFLGMASTTANTVGVTVAILVSIALINQFGIRLAARINDISVVAEIGGTLLIGLFFLGLALVRHVHPVSFLLTHPSQPGGLAYVAPFAFASLMGAWTLTGFEGAANLAEETKIPERQVPFAILSSELISVILGFLVLAGFTLAIPSLEQAQNDPAPLLYVMHSYLPNAVTNTVMLMVFLAIYACALANLTTLTRMIWAMSRDGQLPGSSWLGRLNGKQVPANAIWLVTALAAVFTFWARLEVIITGIAALAGYATYAIVTAASLWGGRKQSREVRAVPPALGWATLAWIGLVLAFLSIPRSGWISVKATAVAVACGFLVRAMLPAGRGRARA